MFSLDERQRTGLGHTWTPLRNRPDQDVLNLPHLVTWSCSLEIGSTSRKFCDYAGIWKHREGLNLLLGQSLCSKRVRIPASTAVLVRHSFKLD